MEDICEFVYMYQMPRKKSVTLLGSALLISAMLFPVSVQAAELVMFWRGGCVWCVRWDRDVGAVYDKTPESRVLPLRRVDVERERTGGIALKEPVRYTPTFVIVDDGREIGRITGYISDESFWGLLGTYAARLQSTSAPSRI